MSPHCLGGCLTAWFPVCGTLWVGLARMVLLQDVYHHHWGGRIWEAIASPDSHFALSVLGYGSRCKSSAAMPALMPATSLLWELALYHLDISHCHQRVFVEKKKLLYNCASQSEGHNPLVWGWSNEPFTWNHRYSHSYIYYIHKYS